MDIQRLRNLTTGRLHTQLVDVYQDIESLSGILGVMTHQLPNARRALEPWLRSVVRDERFWNQEFDPAHTGDVEVRPPTPDEQRAILDRFAAMPNPLDGKQVITVVTR